ncbi:hypothetical protein D3C80_1607920 [compost metagenome]
MVIALPLILVILAPNFNTLAVFGFAIDAGSLVLGIPPPIYKYPVPSSSTSTAGSKSHVTPAIPGVLPVIRALPSGSDHGPIGESAVSTPMPDAPFEK